MLAPPSWWNPWDCPRDTPGSTRWW